MPIWWCEVHWCPSRWAGTKCRDANSDKICRLVRMQLVPEDALVVTKENGEWPEPLRRFAEWAVKYAAEH